jgi:hypothetical protein
MSGEEKDEALAIRQELKWSWDKFFVGIAKIVFHLATIAWAVYTYFLQKILQKVFAAANGELNAYLNSPVMIALVAGWVVITLITACDLQKAFATMVGNAKLSAEFKAGFNKNIDLKADAAQIVSAVRGQQ